MAWDPIPDAVTDSDARDDLMERWRDEERMTSAAQERKGPVHDGKMRWSMLSVYTYCARAMWSNGHYSRLLIEFNAS